MDRDCLSISIGRISMLDDEKLKEIFRIYKPPEVRPIFYRAYYDPKTKEVLHLSQEELDLPYITITKEQFESRATDIWIISEGQLMRKDVYNQIRLQLRPNGVKFASIKDNMQFAVHKDWTGEKDFWDANH